MVGVKGYMVGSRVKGHVIGIRVSGHGDGLRSRVSLGSGVGLESRVKGHRLGGQRSCAWVGSRVRSHVVELGLRVT